MKYRLRYKIRDWFFKHLFPTIAIHEAHLVDDCISMAMRIKELENKRLPTYDTIITTGTECKTTWFIDSGECYYLNPQ